MGRKTWASIPPKFRPLKDRLNIVVTRSSAPTDGDDYGSRPITEAVLVPSLERALHVARARSAARVFVMGGAQIYAAALECPEARRVLLTSIERDFGCDTFFPLDLSAEGREQGWTRRSHQQLQEWTGQDVVEGGQEEAGTKYEFQLWEKE
jgi:dihydrofolate reductase